MSSKVAVADLTEALKKKGIDAFKESFPSKISAINALLGNELLTADTEAILPPLTDITPAVPQPVVVGGGPGGAGRSKKRKMNAGTGAATAAPPPLAAQVHSDSEEESEDEQPGHAGRAGVHYDHAHDFKVPCNKHIIRVMELLRTEWQQAVEIVGAVKLWIQLSIPPIESGGQFHVGVQEEVIQELTRFEDVAYNYLESPSKYFQTRAKLIAKVCVGLCWVMLGWLGFGPVGRAIASRVQH